MASSWSKVFPGLGATRRDRPLKQLLEQIEEKKREVNAASDELKEAKDEFLERYEEMDDARRRTCAMEIQRLTKSLESQSFLLDQLLSARQLAEQAIAQEKHGKTLKSVSDYLEKLPDKSSVSHASASLSDRARQVSETYATSALSAADVDNELDVSKDVGASSHHDMFETLRKEKLLKQAPSMTPERPRHLSRPGSRTKAQKADNDFFNSFMSA